MIDPDYLNHVLAEDVLSTKREFVGLKLSKEIIKRIEKEAHKRGIKKTQMIRLALHQMFGGK